ncbi:uncharacterized protein K452DRAFT_1395 [Aplosporella prunicola CBS 121167]|uniref:Uncharacterized protein n=1 Tax=Aplosporella prunicola CBS 121167 TaxID=1176127 RepID=A0A6A6BUY2_9PEZI|nr:uncharacterized protein K452DRAFT_1395 [Aplosporella prunicola CBS 121167]KAF2147085.1 hypothetical protein K452DRAFT_1395 [Aplosporella prunicola CBS 121167]
MHHGGYETVAVAMLFRGRTQARKAAGTPCVLVGRFFSCCVANGRRGFVCGVVHVPPYGWLGGRGWAQARPWGPAHLRDPAGRHGSRRWSEYGLRSRWLRGAASTVVSPSDFWVGARYSGRNHAKAFCLAPYLNSRPPPSARRRPRSWLQRHLLVDADDDDDAADDDEVSARATQSFSHLHV